MRIAQINTTYGSADSTGRNVKELHEFFKENGCESRVHIQACKAGSTRYRQK